MVKYSIETKYIAVKEYFRGKESLRSLGKRLNIYFKEIGKWLALYNDYGEECLIPFFVFLGPYGRISHFFISFK